MSKDDTQIKFTEEWDLAAQAISPNAEDTIEWASTDAIKLVLDGFMGQNSNHAHLPNGGGLDFLSVSTSYENGFLEFATSERSYYWVKPQKLTFKRINSAGNSFFLLELCPVEIINQDGTTSFIEAIDGRCGYQELLELSEGEFVDRSYWDQGFLSYDETGREIPIPDHARLVSRPLSGKILFVSKGSYWNSQSATYDGRHGKMSADAIRNVIQRCAG